MVFSISQCGAEHCIIFSSLVFCSISPMKVHAQLEGLLLRFWYSGTYRGGSRGRVQGVRTPPEMTCGFLINTVESASQLYKISFIIWYVFSAVHIMLLPSRKPSSSYSLLKFVYVTSQLRHSLVVHPLLRKILDPPLICPLKWNFLDIIFPLYNFDADCRIRGIMTRSFKQFQ